MSYNSLALMGMGRLMPTSEEEREREIARLREKYRQTLRHYAKFRAEYPYTVAKAAQIRARREASKARRAARRANPTSRRGRSSDKYEDIVYPPGYAPPPRRRRERSYERTIREARKSLARNS